MTKARRTREALVDTALRLFREEGYERATMRRIAEETHVATGNAYYHFAGKEALVQELYVRIQDEHRAVALPLIGEGDPVGENLRRVLHAGLDVMAPYHGFGTTLVATALRPDEPVSPFSPESASAREAATGLFAEVVTRSRGVPRGPLREQLPRLLWLSYLGVTLHWVSDTTEGQRRTRVLVDGLAPLLGRALRLAALPPGAGLAADAAALIDRLTKENP